MYSAEQLVETELTRDDVTVDGKAWHDLADAGLDDALLVFVAGEPRLQLVVRPERENQDPARVLGVLECGPLPAEPGQTALSLAPYRSTEARHAGRG